MRKQLGIMLMEDDSGGVAVELFKQPEAAQEAFDQLVGRPGDKPSRATFFVVDWAQKETRDFQSKDLPIVQDPADEPWGYRLGVGPIDEPKEDEGD